MWQVDLSWHKVPQNRRQQNETPVRAAGLGKRCSFAGAGCFVTGKRIWDETANENVSFEIKHFIFYPKTDISEVNIVICY